jgi:hypothetical protein
MPISSSAVMRMGRLPLASLHSLDTDPIETDPTETVWATASLDAR